MPTDPLIGAVLGDRYRIIAPIGRGGAGTVYRALQLQLEREVAVKVVRPDVSESTRAELQARFYREASLAARLAHPAIVQTFDYGTTEHGLQYVAMELLVGRTLKDALRDGPLPAGDAARIGAELARGLHHAHGKGLVHRDVKASNVLLVVDDEGVERPKLLDFGLVKSVTRELDVTQTPTYLGTPLYMSPEQARGSLEIDGRSDQYSLGCLLYAMICGQLPFVGESPMATALLHMSEPYPPMKTRAPGVDVDPALEAIVRRAMERDPGDRFPDAAALARALEAWSTSPAVAVSPVAATHKAGFALLGAAGALGLVGIAAVGVLAVAVVGGAAWWLAQQDDGASAAAGTSSAALEPPAPEPAADPAVPAETDAPAVAEPDLDAELFAPDAPPPVEVAPAAPAPAAPKPAPIAPKPSPEPAPAAPEPAPAAPPAVERPDLLDEPVVIDEVTFTRLSEMKAVLKLANHGTPDELGAAGITGQRIHDLIAGRPYRSVQKLGYTRGVGPDTMRKLFAAAATAD